MSVNRINQTGLISLRQQQHDAFYTSEPGQWFTDVSSLIDQYSDSVSIMALGVGERSILRLTKNLDTIIEREIFSDEQKGPIEGEVIRAKHRGWHPDLVSDLPVGCVPCVAEVDGYRYGAGLVILAGKGDVGKTPFIHAFGAYLAGEEDYAVVRFGEPMSGYNSDIDSFIQDVAEAMLTDRVIVIDSFKDLVGASGGNATKGGVTRGIFQIMSDLGAMAATRGCVIIAAINPTTSDPRVIDEVNEAARSNATALVVSGNGSDWQVVTRVGEGLQRITHSLTSHYEDRVMKFSDQRKAASRSSRNTKIQATITNEEFESVIRRMTQA